MRFAALGRTHLLYDAILEAARRGHEPVLIGTARPAPEYRRLEVDFEQLAREIGCPYFSGGDASWHLEEIRQASAEVAISVNWPNVLAAEVLDAFPRGILNAHAGDLPRYRGNAAPNWAILEGEEAVALSIHQMSPELDAGPVLAHRVFPLTEKTYITDVYAFLEATLPQLFADVLDELKGDLSQPKASGVDEPAPLRGLPRRPSDSRIDWSLPSVRLDRLVRASAEPFAGAYTYLDGVRLTVWRAHSEPLPYPHLGTPGQVAWVRPGQGTVAVLTGDGFLVLEEVSTPAGNRQSAAEVVRSSRARFGVDVDETLEVLTNRIEELERLLGERERGPGGKSW
ncbi:MAG: methionyl-tRNA formyltransferase [Solirubrobacteraceae bacterium]